MFDDINHHIRGIILENFQDHLKGELPHVK